MMSPLADQLQREQALDITRSFIVQAPAGSGKTELLIQRYLALLSQSERPESVLAITFTRKAAAEMRTRILDALHLAKNQPEPPLQPYHRKRWMLAKKLYEWQNQKGWNLLLTPHRLQIQTIDAFYTQLARKAPLQAGLHPSTTIAQQATILYQEAVHLLLARLEEDSALGHALVSLARYLNNDHAQMERLFIHMLGHRDQWLFLVQEGAEDFDQLRHVLEKSLWALYQEHVDAIEQLLSTQDNRDWMQAFKSLLVFSCKMRAIEDVPSETDTQFWPSVADLLLTKEGQWRHTLTKTQGFPSPQHASSADEKEIYTFMKQKGMNLLKDLRPNTALCATLHRIRGLPPTYYTESQWSILKSLFYVLSALVTFLRFIFDQYNEVDYIEISLKALTILGEETQPTETLLHLDYQIQHILIDEFQDTSLQQLRFLRRLTAGWEPHDKRTLFLVGDPMQSIYRFRKAEVRLFTMVQNTGIGHCLLDTLTLSTNFRASLPLVNWLNHHFNAMVAQINTQASHELRFVPSTTALDSSNTPPISDSATYTYWANCAEHELNTIIAVIKQEASANKTIGILGRTRQHLLPIIHRLRTEHIDYQAVEIETLADRPIIQDLLILTRALTHLGDEIAWMALLRAPWCGIPLEDLHTIMQACQPHQPTRLIWDQLHYYSHELQLTPFIQERIQYVLNQLHPIIKSYGRVPLKDRVKQAWFKLGGLAIQYHSHTHTHDIDTFFKCLNDIQVGETLVDINALEERLATVYTQPLHTAQSEQVTIMTMHKAKGLEFDTVILPSLHKTTRHNPYPLILFDEAPTLHDRRLLIASLLKTDEQNTSNKVYAYLRKQDQVHHHAEILRLFYVACTRAKQTLYLTATMMSPHNTLSTPMMGSLLYWLWPTLTEEQKQLAQDQLMPPESNPNTPPVRHIERMHFPVDALTRPTQATSAFTYPNPDAHTHPTISRTLARIIRQLFAHLTEKRLSQSELFEQKTQWLDYYPSILNTLLLQTGMHEAQIESEVQIGIRLLAHMLTDARGQWLLSGAHQTIHTLYPISNETQSFQSAHAIDHLFIDTDNQHWIAIYLFDSPSQFTDIHTLDIYPALLTFINTYPHIHSLYIGLYWPETHHWLALPADKLLSH